MIILASSARRGCTNLVSALAFNNTASGPSAEG
jgi:hypothetical protein